MNQAAIELPELPDPPPFHLNGVLLTNLEGRRGADVRIAYAGQTALALVEGGWVPDAVLSDLRMPGMDGGDWQGDRKRTEQAGFDGYLLKPLALHEFAAALQGLRRPA